MDAHRLKEQFETEQYRNQANVVYVSTAVVCSILAVIFLLIVNCPVFAFLNLASAAVCIVAVRLNRRQRYGISSLLYIGFVTIFAVFEAMAFSPAAGFHYIFISMAALIVYTNWRTAYKIAGVMLQAGLLAALRFLTYEIVPLIPMSQELISFFHTFNAVFNIVGVANSAYYFMSISTRAHAEIIKLAVRDYLTNLLNRSAFEEELSRMLENRKKTTQNIGILILDIDHFKVINDSYGHLCGDEVLRQFSSILTENVREEDCAARYGGEEFVILSAVDSPDQLQDLAERLRKDTENREFLCNGSVKRMTISIGALYVPSHVTITRQQALSLVDRLLYRAKEEGRNRTVFDQVKQ